MEMDLKLQRMLLETFKAELQEIYQSLVTNLLSLEKASDKDELKAILNTLFRHSHNIKGAAASVSISSIATMAHRLEDLFSLWLKDSHIPSMEEINACLEMVDNFFPLLVAFEKKEGMGVDLQPTTHGDESASHEFIKLPLTRIEKASAKANELTIYQLKLTTWFKNIEELLKMHDLDASITNALRAIYDDNTQFFGDFSRAVKGLQNDLKSMRLLPFSTLLAPLVRVVRDVSATLGKSVELEVYGGDIELDKTILDAISNPMQHIIRNAIVHGIESKEQRKKLKKSIPAKIQINLSQVSGKIMISITDDGCGIDLERVKQTAIQKNLITAEAAHQLSDSEIRDLIFLPGLTLQQEVTEVAGRGVGLDAVKDDLQRIHGFISVESKSLHGCVFTLNLPLTLATTRGIFFTVKNQQFMFPTLSIKALFAVEKKELKVVNNQLVYVVRNKPLPVFSLNYILNKEDTLIEPRITYFGLLIEHVGHELLLLVDSIINEHDCVVKPLPAPLNQLTHYIGITQTGDSTLVPVLESGKIYEMAITAHFSSKNLDMLETDLKKLKKRVLIVDDSITTRSLCAHALEAAGYDTTTVINGQKAWELLQQEFFECVITDIVMPELDGIELTMLIKKNKRLSHIPVIIMSFLDTGEDKKRGLEAGANAFLVKSEFDTQSLIHLMESLL